MRRLVSCAVVVAIGSVSACGGGGGADTATAPLPGVFVPGVAYVADAEVDERFELFTAALDGSGFVKVSAAPQPGDDVQSFAWSPDRGRLAYLLRHANGQVELFVAAPDGTSAIGVSGPIAASESVNEFQWSPASDRLAYSVVRFDAAFMVLDIEVWSVRSDGTGLVRLCPDLPDGRAVEAFAWSPDAQRVAYVADQGADDVPRLYAVGGAGGVAIEVSAGIAADRLVRFTPNPSSAVVKPFAWSPDSTRLAFVAEHDDGGLRNELLTAAPGGAVATLFTGAPADVVVLDFAWAPDGARIAFLTGSGLYALDERLRTDLPAGGDPEVFDAGLPVASVPIRFAFAPDSRLAWNVLTATSESYTYVEASPVGPAVEILHFTLPSDPSLLWSPHGTWLALSSALVSAGMPHDAVSMNLGTVVEGVLWSPDDVEVAYVTSVSAAAAAVVSRPDTSYGRVRVSPPLGVARGVTTVRWTPDSERLLYLVDVAGFDVYELYASTRDGSSAVRVSGPLVFGGQVTAFEVR